MIPTRNQWEKWSLPSKLTAVGAYVGLISLIISLISFNFPSSSAPEPENHSLVGNWYLVSMSLNNGDEIPVDDNDKLAKYLELAAVNTSEPFFYFSNDGRFFSQLMYSVTMPVDQLGNMDVKSGSAALAGISIYYMTGTGKVLLSPYSHERNDFIGDRGEFDYEISNNTLTIRNFSYIEEFEAIVASRLPPKI
ncbi:hypothetical protein BZG06_15825 [Salinivibrio kushneri]|uniref:Lipocalin-like domain-containing protein n=2 Tax=Salinivibrio kushneri TaxID=1908198 RepID=A0AB36K4L6_9GAMM|nr:hypothetical protein BZG06_15825 [Salinivibrio kushneri]OOE43096.1 hypothetical protein BZG09_11790 [Salinivibrio kushneri]